jgi:enoyl-CoA hydratase
MLLSNRWIKGEEAYRIGLVNRLVTKDKLVETAEQMAGEIASRNVRAVKLAKQAVMRGLDLPLRDGLELEKRLATQLKR